MKTSFVPKKTALFLLIIGMSFSLLYSNVENAEAVPDQVTDLQLTVISNSQVDLTWTAPNDGGTPILSYIIQRNHIVEGVVTLESAWDPNGSTIYSDTALVMGDQVTYRIQAVNADGPGPFSNVPVAVTLDDDPPPTDVIQEILDSIDQILVDILQLQNDLTNHEHSGPGGPNFIDGDLEITGNILPSGDICIGTCP